MLVTKMLIAPILTVLTYVHVDKDLLEMVQFVKVCQWERLFTASSGIKHSSSRLDWVLHETRRHFHFYRYRLLPLKYSSTVLNDSNVYPPGRQYAQSTQPILLVSHQTEIFSFVPLEICSVNKLIRLCVRRFLDAMTQNATQCHHILLSFIGASITYVHCSH